MQIIRIKTRFLLALISIVLIWLLLEIIYISSEDVEASILWFVLPCLFGSLIYLSWRVGYLILFMFCCLNFISHAIIPPLFFIGREQYTFSGWTAVKNFDFTLEQYLPMIFPVFVHVVLVFVMVVIIQTIFHKGASYRTITMKFIYKSFPRRKEDAKNKHETLRWCLLLLSLIILASMLNSWMFRNGIAMTGIAPPALPYKMTGILYYLTRFVMPIVFAFIYWRTNRSWFISFILLFYASWAGLSQISRTTITTYSLPVLFGALFQRRYALFLFESTFFALATQLVGLARNFVYIFTGAGIESASLDISLVTIVLKTFTEGGFVSPVKFIQTYFSRIGGGQDIVLASQYNVDAIGGAMFEFKRYFLQIGELDGDLHHLEWIGQTLQKGFVAAGGFTSEILIIAHGSWIILTLLSLFVAIIIVVGEKLVIAYTKETKSPIIGFMVGFVFIIFMYALGNMNWLYFYIALLVIFLFMIRNGMLRFFKKGSKSPFFLTATDRYSCREINQWTRP